MRARVNLHMHTRYGDGGKTVSEIVSTLVAAGVTTFSVTDHDEAGGNAEAAELAEKYGLRYVSGVELTCRLDGGLKYELGERGDYYVHLLGYGFDVSKMQARLLNIRQHGEAPTVGDGINIILSSGGVAVLAHPFGINLRDKKITLVEEQAERLVSFVSGYGAHGIEVYYGPYSKSQINFLEGIANRYGLSKSIGTDYHGNDEEKYNDRLFFEKEGISPDVTIIELF